MNRPTEFPLGIDVVEFRKTESLYKTHQDKLSRFLTKPERDFVETNSKPPVALAMLLGAKEAVFKALRPAWLGVTPFKDIEVIPSKKHFSLKFKGEAKKMVRSETRLELLFFKQKDFMVVECAGIW